MGEHLRPLRVICPLSDESEDQPDLVALGRRPLRARVRHRTPARSGLRRTGVEAPFPLDAGIARRCPSTLHA